MTRITLKDENGTYLVESAQDFITIDDVFEQLVEPLLLAAGYSQELIDSYFRSDHGKDRP